MSDGVNAWTVFVSSMAITSNKAGGGGMARLASNAGIADANYSVQAEQYMKGDISFAYNGVSGSLFLIGRYVDANNFYCAYISSLGAGNEELNYRIGKVVSGNYSNIVTDYENDGAGTTWRFDLDGTSLKLFKDGSQVLSTTDSTFTSIGYPGVSSAVVVGTTPISLSNSPAYYADNFIVKGTAASSGVTVNATTDALILTENAATISYDINIAAGVDTLTLTEYSADVVYGVNINATTASLTLTEYSATVDTGSNDVEVSASTASLTLTEYPAFVEYPTFITASYDTLTLIEYAATVATGTSTLTNPGATGITYNGWTAKVDVL